MLKTFKKSSALITAATLAIGLSACTSKNETNQNEEQSSNFISQAESQVDNSIDTENKSIKAEPEKFWFNEDECAYINPDYFKVADFDLMITQRVKLPEQILNNDDFKILKEKIKNYIGDNNLYFNAWTNISFDYVSLSVINDDTNSLDHILYIDYTDYSFNDHLCISYTDWNDYLYARVNRTYSYDFDKNGNTIRKYILNEYNDYNNKYEIEIENDVIKMQTLTYQAETAPFKIKLYNKNDESEKNYRLEIETSCGWNGITLTPEDYDVLSTQMQKCISKDELLNFVSNNQKTLEKHLESVKPEYYDDGYHQAEWLIESYAEKGKTKVLVP